MLLRGENKEIDQRGQLAWQFATTGPFEVSRLGGTHQQIWQEPWVQEQARCLVACVESAGTRSAARSSAPPPSGRPARLRRRPPAIAPADP